MKTGYKLELLTEETMKLLGGSKKDIDQDKDGDKVLFTFVPNKQFGQLITIESQSLTMLKTTSA